MAIQRPFENEMTRLLPAIRSGDIVALDAGLQGQDDPYLKVHLLTNCMLLGKPDEKVLRGFDWVARATDWLAYDRKWRGANANGAVTDHIVTQACRHGDPQFIRVLMDTECRSCPSLPFQDCYKALAESKGRSNDPEEEVDRLSTIIGMIKAVCPIDRIYDNPAFGAIVKSNNGIKNVELCVAMLRHGVMRSDVDAFDFINHLASIAGSRESHVLVVDAMRSAIQQFGDYPLLTRVSQRGESLLHILAKRNQNEAILFLHDHCPRADFFEQNDKGDTPLDTARKWGSSEAQSLLTSIAMKQRLKTASAAPASRRSGGPPA